MNRSIFHIDFNSYFATVEQQKNPALRGKPVGVLKAEGRTVVIAASVEAKRRGVKTGMSVRDARRLCPLITFVPADFDSYYDTTKRFVEITSRYSDVVELFSLDEVFLDVTQTSRIFGDSRTIANLLKQDIRKELGECLTVSIGIAKNKFLAKLASDMEKPDGLVELTDENQDFYLGKAAFDQVCGIGRRLEKRLRAMGIRQLLDIRAVPEQCLFAQFGPYWTDHLRRLAWGIDGSPVIPLASLPLPKSVSRTYTLFRDLVREEEILATVRNLVEEAAEKLRLAQMAGRQFGLTLRYQDFSRTWFTTRKVYTNDPLAIFDGLRRLYDAGRWNMPVRFVGVWIALLAEESTLTASLFPDVRRRQELLAAQDRVNGLFGHYTLFPARLLETRIVLPEVNGYLGDERTKERIRRMTISPLRSEFSR